MFQLRSIGLHALAVSGAVLTTLMTGLPADALSFTGTGGVSPLGQGANTTFSFGAFDRSDFGSDPAYVITEVALTIDSIDASALVLQMGGIELYLESSGAAQRLTLKDRLANSISAQYSSVFLTDTASTAVDTAASSPVTGNFRPQGTAGSALTSTITTFAGFDGTVISSTPQTWSLQVFNSDIGAGSANLTTFTLHILVEPVPFEVNGTLGLLALGGLLAGHHWFKRRHTQEVDKLEI